MPPLLSLYIVLLILCGWCIVRVWCLLLLKDCLLCHFCCIQTAFLYRILRTTVFYVWQRTDAISNYLYKLSFAPTRTILRVVKSSAQIYSMWWLRCLSLASNSSCYWFFGWLIQTNAAVSTSMLVRHVFLRSTSSTSSLVVLHHKPQHAVVSCCYMLRGGISGTRRVLSVTVVLQFIPGL